MESEQRLIDFEKARKSVMEILAGKVNTPTAVKISVAMKEATVDAVILPCKIGETVYMIRDCSCYGYDRLNNSNSRRKCSGKVYLGKKSRKCHCGYVSEAKFGLKHIADFGKTIFLTREEAKAVLAKMDKKENP